MKSKPHRKKNGARRASKSATDRTHELQSRIARISQCSPGLEKIPGVGASIARSIRDILLHGRLAMVDRLRGESEAIAVLASVPGVGKTFFFRRFHDDLGIETLEELEVAAHDGRIQNYPGIGAKRLAGVRDLLAQRLGRIRRRTTAPAGLRVPPISELPDVDLEYREKATLGTLTQIAPRRFNPEGEAWLPILHTARDGRHYTALFSNTARAHELGKTRDWVVLFCDNGDTEHRFTVITSEFGRLQGERIVAGREAECEKYYDRTDGAFPNGSAKM